MSTTFSDVLETATFSDEELEYLTNPEEPCMASVWLSDSMGPLTKESTIFVAHRSDGTIRMLAREITFLAIASGVSDRMGYSCPHRPGGPWLWEGYSGFRAILSGDEFTVTIL